MCGIAGIVRFDDQPIDVGRAIRMRDAVRHRGPDGEGIAELGRCTLVHTRLGVIDLLGGRQPMSVPPRGEQGPLTLVFNGEIYNHRSLRKQLTMLGHQFASDHCDTEVLIHGYRQWGNTLAKRLHGMFAFAIWDGGQRRLFLCRDRVGKKPLYLRWSSGRSAAGELSFASTISALVAGGARPPTVDHESMLTFLRFGYTFNTSLIRGIEELPAAHWMTIDAGGAVEKQRYWQPPPISRSSTSTGALRATRELLEEAVHTRLEADVPLGCFLSGGIDSSIVAAMAQKQMRERGGDRLKTYCVAMPDLDYDESAHAQLVANHLDTRHRQLVAEHHQSVIPDLQRLIAVMGEPTADSSILPTFWLCQASRQEVTVALCGDGGDELFGGYDRYRAMRILARSGWWLRLAPLTLLRSANPRSRRHRFARLVEAARRRTQSQQYREIVQLFSDEQIRDLTAAGGMALLPPNTGVPVVLPDWPQENDPAHAAMRWDLMHYLPFDLLRKMDRASMAVALEVRCPILDTQVLDLAGHLPTRVLLPGGRAKGLLRQVAADMGLPQSIVNRPKRGFALPIGRWFRGPLKEALAQHIIEGELGDVGIDRYAAEQLLDEHSRGVTDHTHRLFALLMLSLWAGWMKRV
jgi:asparagine synthase (glutamine-hydrolysing)